MRETQSAAPRTPATRCHVVCLAVKQVCEAMQLLASPDSLGGTECQREMKLAEDIGKECI
jgi:hypothetical protein